MLKRIFIILLAGLFLFSGCSENEEETMATPTSSALASPTTSPSASISASAEAEPDSEGEMLLLLPGLLGKSDEEVTGILGDGTVRFGADAKTMEAREYRFKVLRVDLEVSAFYQEGVISNFDIYLSGLNFETWKEAMTGWFGKPVKEMKKNKTNSAVRAVFRYEDAELTLMEAYGALSIRIEPVDAEE